MNRVFFVLDGGRNAPKARPRVPRFPKPQEPRHWAQKRPKTFIFRKWRPARTRTMRAGRHLRKMLSEERFSARRPPGGAPPAPVASPRGTKCSSGPDPSALAQALRPCRWPRWLLLKWWSKATGSEGVWSKTRWCVTQHKKWEYSLKNRSPRDRDWVALPTLGGLSFSAKSSGSVFPLRFFTVVETLRRPVLILAWLQTASSIEDGLLDRRSPCASFAWAN